MSKNDYRISLIADDRERKSEVILQGLPRVGSERAARLLDEFGSVEAVVTATSKELQSGTA